MKRATKKIFENLYGPSGTFLLHLIVVLALAKFVHFQNRSVERDIEVIIKDIEPMEELDEIEEEIEELDVPTVVEAVAPPTVSMDDPPQVDTMKAPGEDFDVSDFDVVDTTSPMSLAGLYSSRGASGRKGALRKYSSGLGERTEFAVMKALKWLKTHQYPNGSWGPSYRASMTGLALLTFLAHGETTASPEFGEAIRSGLRFLLGSQREGVFVGGGPVDFWHYPTKYKEQVRSYEHAIATYAISEAYNLSKIPYLKKPMQGAVQVMLDGQHEAGSWDYGYIHGAEAQIDVSLAGWHIQALKAASWAGAENDGLKAAIEASVRGLDLQYRNSNMFQYSTRGKEHPEDLCMTGVAVLCKQLTGHALDENVKRAMISLRNCQFVWAPDKEKGKDNRGMGRWPFYAWYYITQARFQHGGRGWAAWNKQFAPVLCDMQNPDGSWCPAPGSSESMFGPVYFTTLATLQLEVYYRLLPTFQPVKIDAGPDLDEALEEDDIVITLG